MLGLEEGNILRLIYTDVDPEKEEEFKQWYDAEHEPKLNSVEGVLQNYKGVNLAGEGQRYFFLYVHKTVSIQSSEEYRAVSQTEWSKKLRPFVRNFEVENYKPIGGPQIPRGLRQGTVIRTLRFDLKADSGAQFQDWFRKVYTPFAIRIPGLVAVWGAISLQSNRPKHLILYFLENLAVGKMLSLEGSSDKLECVNEMISDPAMVVMDYGIQR